MTGAMGGRRSFLRPRKLCRPACQFDYLTFMIFSAILPLIAMK